MSYTIRIKPKAKKAIDDLPSTVKDRVKAKIRELAGDLFPRGCRKLEGFGEIAWRVRVGDWRIVYGIDDQEKAVIISDVAHRRTIYRRR